MSENVNITQLPLTTSMQNTDTMVVISDGKAKRFSYGNLAGNLNDWSSITNKVFDTYDKEYFNGLDKKGYNGMYIATYSSMDEISGNGITSV